MSNQPRHLTRDEKTNLDVDKSHNEKYTGSLSPNPSDCEGKSESSFPGSQTPERRSSESSTARSAYAGIEPVTEKPGVSIKELVVYHTKWHLCLTIRDANNAPLYYVDNSHWTP